MIKHKTRQTKNCREIFVKKIKHGFWKNYYDIQVLNHKTDAIQWNQKNDTLDIYFTGNPPNHPLHKRYVATILLDHSKLKKILTDVQWSQVLDYRLDVANPPDIDPSIFDGVWFKSNIEPTSDNLKSPQIFTDKKAVCGVKRNGH